MRDDNLRRSYLLWEEQVVPILTLEVVSRKRSSEYRQKKIDYAELGVRYYVIYNALRKVKERLEVYRLENGEYILMTGNPIWLPEIGLGLGRERAVYQGIEREWLYWYDQTGKRYPTPEELVRQAQQQAMKETLNRQKEEAQLAVLRQKMRELGLDPEL